MTQHTQRLDALVRAAAPIHGVGVGTLGDSSTVRIDFRPDATPEQRAAAQAVVDSFDWSDAAQSAWEADRVPERKALRAAAATALAANANYLAIATPTASQVRQQTEALTRQVQHLIRRLAQID